MFPDILDFKQWEWQFFGFEFMKLSDGWWFTITYSTEKGWKWLNDDAIERRRWENLSTKRMWASYASAGTAVPSTLDRNFLYGFVNIPTLTLTSISDNQSIPWQQFSSFEVVEFSLHFSWLYPPLLLLMFWHGGSKAGDDQVKKGISVSKTQPARPSPETAVGDHRTLGVSSLLGCDKDLQ